MEIFIYVGIGLAVILIIYLISKMEKRSKSRSEALREIGESDPKRDYYVLSDIQFHDGIRQAKIDHLVINTSGIHAVIEYQYQGEIKGDQEDEKWSYEYKGVSDEFKNPLLTARDLKLSIDKVLKKDYPLFLYIVFPEHTTIKRRRTNYPILLSNELKDEMQQNYKSKKKISSENVSLINELFIKVKNK